MVFFWNLIFLLNHLFSSVPNLGFQPKVPLPRFGEPSPTPEDYQELEFPLPPPALAISDYNDAEDEESLEEAMLADRLLRLRQR